MNCLEIDIYGLQRNNGNVKNDKYETILSYPFTRLNISKMKKKVMIKEYNEDKTVKGKLFTEDLRILANERLGIITDYQFNAIYDKAYEDSHPNGHSEVALYFNDLLDLLKKFVKK